MSSALAQHVNAFFKGKPASYVVKVTLFITWGLLVAKHVHGAGGIKAFLMKWVFKFIKSVPLLAGKVQEGTDKEIKKIHDSFLKMVDQHDERHVTLPKDGVDQKHLLAKMTEWNAFESKQWNSGKVTGAVYHGGKDLQEFITQVYGLFAISNPLHPETFPFVRKMEAEVIRMTLNLFNGDAKTSCGVMTAGGTESIITALHAYRELAKSRGISDPEIICPRTAHAAFGKGAHYFGMKIVQVPVNPVTFEADIDAMAAKINRNTIVLIGSAINYPYGTLDNITALSELAVQHNICLHVDSCLGSFLQAYMPKIGYPDNKSDFRLPGVTSISCDTHKFGFAPKGSSVLMWKTAKLRHFQYFIDSAWPGGIYATPGMGGSRAGGLIACTWATMVSLGDSGYRQIYTKIMATSTAMQDGVRGFPELAICGNPVNSTFAFVFSEQYKHLNILMVGESMTAKGWHLGPLQKPSALHFTVGNCQIGFEGEFLKDLRVSVDDVLANPGKYKDGAVALYGVAEQLEATGVIDDVVKGYIDMLTVLKN